MKPRFPKMLSCKRVLRKDLVNDELRAICFPKKHEDQPPGLRLEWVTKIHHAVIGLL